MQFVNFQELDTTIEGLTKLRTQMKNDTRIKMGNALAALVTEAMVLRFCVTDRCSDAVIVRHARRLAEAVKEYEKVEKGDR